MALSVEKLLTDAHTLIIHLKDHDCLADNIIGSTQALYKKIEAMKQYQDDITELNEIAKHRPRSTLVLGIAQENRQIRELQQENRELEASLEEHQSALELIMQKYREHTVKLLQSNRMERALEEKDSVDKNSMYHLMDKIDEMAGVMQKAIEVDESVGYVDREKLSRLEVENRALREMLEICTTSKDKIISSSESKEPVSEVKPDGQDNADDEDDTTDTESDVTVLESADSLKDEDEIDTDVASEPEKEVVKGADKQKKEEVKEKSESKPTEEKKRKSDVATKEGGVGAGAKSMGINKSGGDVRKGRAVTPSAKRGTSGTLVKKESTLKKTPVDTKKDSKGKPAGKAQAKKSTHS